MSFLSTVDLNPHLSGLAACRTLQLHAIGPAWKRCQHPIMKLAQSLLIPIHHGMVEEEKQKLHVASSG